MMTSTRRLAAFTLVELAVVLVMLALGASLLAPALARTRPNSKAFKCLNNLRLLTAAWSTYTTDYGDSLLTCQTDQRVSGRVNWCTGLLELSNQAYNWDIRVDIVKSPLWGYTSSNATVFRCPADPSAVQVNGVPTPRVRSYSMSQVFGTGDWLGTGWRTYSRGAEIVIPSKTFVFIEEHPGSINDAAFGNICTGAQPTDPPSSAKIVDFPASTHQGAGPLSFADGHVVLHKWLGTTIKPPPGSYLALNVSAGDSWMDIQWLAQNTTVKR
jgi:prepilin-type processing-associated H-X9-DG protein